jgi:outer membrane protein OmpA-like peptidoglycan-associated protein
MKYIILFILLSGTIVSFSQQNARDKEFVYEKNRLHENILRLEPVYQVNPNQQLALDLAEDFYKLRKFEKALIYYEMAINTGDPLQQNYMLNYFNALFEYGDWDQCKKIAEEYKNRFKRFELLKKIDTLEKLKNHDPTYYETNLASNTEHNEYGQIPYTANFKLINCDINLNRGTYEKKTFSPYVVSYKDNATKYPLYQPLIEKSDKYYDAVSHYDENESKIYFTRTFVENDLVKNMKIYTAIIDANFNLSLPVEFPYNSELYSVGQACVAKEGDILYFVSDMPGGKGGTDLYRCMKLESGAWGTPINLGDKINSIGNELYPYISPQGNTMYFSSDFNSLFGGLDIFKSQKTRFHSFSKPENMGLPFNSDKDDYGLVFNDNYGTEGFFTSNRITDNKGGDDIYHFSYQNNKVCRDPVKNFKMTVIDKKTKERIANVNLKMTVKADGRVFQDITDINGEVHLTVEGCNDFDVEATRDFYLNNLFYYDGFRKQVTIELDKKELNNIIELESIYYEVGKYEVPTASYSQLDKLATMLKKNPDVKIELSSHTDSRGDDASNQKLSLNRAESIVKYVTKAGVDKAQLVPVGYGETKLINNCGNDAQCDDIQHEKNRRTEFKILEINFGR